MGIPAWTTQDFAGAFARLLPRGRAWPAREDPRGVQAQAIAPLMGTYARLAARDAYLLTDAFPATTDELLPEWELSLGLPDPCAGPSPTLQQRQAQVVARLTGRGGQSVPYYTRFAAALGFTITVTQYAPFRAGRSRSGQPACGRAWANAWTVSAPQLTATRFRAGRSASGEAIAVYATGATLRCELNRIKPAHTILQFKFGVA